MRYLSLLLVAALVAAGGYYGLTRGSDGSPSDLMGALKARFTSDTAVPVSADAAWSDPDFDPALEVAYGAHPEEYGEVLGELELDEDGILQWQAPERTVTPAIVAAAIKHGSGSPARPGARTGNDYSFPDLEDGPEGLTLVINDEPIPGRSSRRLLRDGGGELVSNGDTVALQYDLFSWSTGKRVESSVDALGGPLTVRLGSSSSPLPAAVDKALRDRRLGSRVQVVLAQGTPDLPDHLNPSDGYVLIADLQRASGNEVPASHWPEDKLAAAAARQTFGSP